MHSDVLKPLLVAFSAAVASYTIQDFNALTDGMLSGGRFLTAVAMILGAGIAIYKSLKNRKNDDNSTEK